MITQISPEYTAYSLSLADEGSNGTSSFAIVSRLPTEEESDNDLVVAYGTDPESHSLFDSVPIGTKLYARWDHQCIADATLTLHADPEAAISELMERTSQWETSENDQFSRQWHDVNVAIENFRADPTQPASVSYEQGFTNEKGTYYSMENWREVICEVTKS